MTRVKRPYERHVLSRWARQAGASSMSRAQSQVAATILMLLVALASWQPVAAADAADRATLDRIDATRLSLSHGRLDRVRAEGIAAGLPEAGSPVELDPAAVYRNIPGVTATPGFDVPPTVLQLIGGDTSITLDDDGDGKPDLDSAIVQAASWLPASFSLLVAEGMAGPADVDLALQWRRPNVGTLYATVGVPGTDIVPGTALVTERSLQDYSANSVLYEAPDVGFPIQDGNQDGGLSAISARVTATSAGGRMAPSGWISRQLGYANPMEANITVQEQEDVAGYCWVTLQAELDGSFGNPVSGLAVDTYTTFRWEIEDLLIDDVTGSPDLRVKIPAGDYKVTLVASNFGPYSTVYPGLLLSPFQYPPGEAPFLRDTFSSYGSTLSDTIHVECDPPDEPVAALVVEKLPDPVVVVSPPGALVTYTLVITNTGEVPVTIFRIEDVVDGVVTELDPECAPPLPIELPPADPIICTFTAFVNGPLGDDHEDTAIVYAYDEDGNLVTARASASVEVRYPRGELLVTKEAEFDEIDIPGGPVTYWVTVFNGSETTDVTVGSVVDVPFGDLEPFCEASFPVLLKPGEGFACEFEADLTGSNGTLWKNVVTVRGIDANGDAIVKRAEADVLITDFLTDLSVVKRALVESPVPEPGLRSVWFEVEITNLSTWDSVDLASVRDSTWGEISSTCVDASGAMTLHLPPQGWVICRIQLPLLGQPADVHEDDVEVTGTDSDNDPVHGLSNTVTITFKDVPSSLKVTKAAAPLKLPASGGTVTYTVTIENTSPADVVTIEGISDSAPFPTGPGCQGLVGRELQPGESVPCSYEGFIDPAGLPRPASEGQILRFENEVTVAGEDDDGQPVHDSATAVVTVERPTSCMVVSKTATPEFVLEPGGYVFYTLDVENCANRPFTITDISDDRFPLLGLACRPSIYYARVEAGSSVSCVYYGRVDGQPGGEPHRNTVTVRAEYGVLQSDSLTGTATAEVEIRDVPSSIAVTKSARLQGATEGSAVYVFRVVVKNTSMVDDVVIDDVIDLSVGGVEAQRQCSPGLGTPIPPGGQIACRFLVTYFGRPGSDHYDVALAVGTDDDGQPVAAWAGTTVTLPSAMPPVVRKWADPSVVDEPGDLVGFTIAVTNVSAIDPITIIAVDDDVPGACRELIGATLAPGQTRVCTYEAPVVASELVPRTGLPETNIVVVQAEVAPDRPLKPVEASATVWVRPAPVPIVVTKRPHRDSAPSGTPVIYTVTVHNRQPYRPLTVVSVVDDRVGDVRQWCDRSLPAQLAPWESMICRYTGVVSGQPGDRYINVVTATGARPWFFGDPPSASAAAVVVIEESPEPTPSSTPTPAPTDEPDDADPGTPADRGTWKLFDVITNPRGGELVYDTPRTASTCTLGDGQLSIDHAKYSNLEATVDVIFDFSYTPPPGDVPPGTRVELPMDLSVSGMQDSENAVATAGFSSYQDTLSVAACSLTECGGSPDAQPQQSGRSSITFPSVPTDPSRLFEFEAFLNDSSQIGGNCRVRYVYEYAP